MPSVLYRQKAGQAAKGDALTENQSNAEMDAVLLSAWLLLDNVGHSHGWQWILFGDIFWIE